MKPRDWTRCPKCSSVHYGLKAVYRILCKRVECDSCRVDLVDLTPAEIAGIEAWKHLPPRTA